MSSVQGRRVIRLMHVTLTSKGVLIFQFVAPTVLETPEGTLPPKACAEPKDMLAEFVPEPPSTMPLASDCKVRVSEHAAGKHWPDACGITRTARHSAITHLVARNMHKPSSPQLAVATKLMVLLMAPADSV